MPVFNSYTRPTPLGDTFKPIDDNIQLLGTQTMYNRAEQNAQRIGGQFSNLFGVNAYGKDAEVLGQIEENARKQIQEIAKGNLDSPETTSKINSLISQYKNHPDVQAITQRSLMKASEEAKQQKFAEKGERYTSPFLKSLNEYHAKGEYYTNPEGLNFVSGWVVPDDAKLMKAAKDITEKKKRIVENPDGTRYTEEYYDPSDLRASLTAVQKSNPNYAQQKQSEFLDAHKNTDWNTYAQETYLPLVEEAQNFLYSNPKASFQERQKAQNIINTYGNIANNPSAVEEIKSQAYQDYLNSDLENQVSAMDAVQQSVASMNEIKKMNYESGLRKSEKLRELQLKTGLTPREGESQNSYIERLSQAAFDKDLELAKAKADIQTQALKERGQNANDLKIEYLNAQGQFKQVTNKNGDKINLGGETFDKNTLLNSLGDAQTVKKVLESNASKFGLDCPTCNGSIDNTHGLVDKGDYYEYQQDSWVPGGETTFRINKDALKAYILDSGVNIDLNRGDVIDGGELKQEEAIKTPENAVKENPKNPEYSWNGEVPKGNVKVKNKDGKIGYIPESQLQEAINNGYSKIE